MLRPLVQDASDVTAKQGENLEASALDDRTGHPLTAEGEEAVAQSLAADVLASLANAEPSPRRERSDARVESDADAIYRELRGDVGLLEERLTEQSAALREARAEADHLRTLVRDVTARFEVLPDAGAELAQAKLERDHAVARAIEAEAARADLSFQLDEVRGHLMALGAAEGALPGESLHTTCARLVGTVRGLLSARAEAEERRDLGWARCVLLEQDGEDLRIEVRSLQRDLGEAQEQHELLLAESRSLSKRLEGSVAAPAAAELRGECSGLRARADEADRALSAVQLKVAEHARGGARVDAEISGLHQRLAELQRALGRETEKVDEARARLAQGEADRLVAAAQLARVQGDLDALRALVEHLRGLQRRVLDRLSVARAEVERLAAQRARALGESSETMHQVRDALAELAAAVERVMRAEGSAAVSDQTEPGGPTPLE
jgi:chromosome segregation ATPase